MNNLKQLLVKNLSEQTLRVIVSNRRNKQVSQKVVFRPFWKKVI